MIARELLGEAARLGVDDEVDVALAVERDVLALVLGDRGKAHLAEQGAQQLGIGRGIFDEFEPVGAHRVFKPERTKVGGWGGAGHEAISFAGSTAPQRRALQVGRPSVAIAASR